MPFKLYNAPEIFQNYINETLHEHLNKFYLTYLNNILIYSDTEEKNLKHIKIILEKLRKTELYLNIKKYEFKIKTVKYLSLIITDEEIKINPVKIKTI